MKKLKLALVWPKGYDPEYAMPLPLAYLKSNLGKGHYDIRIIDCALRDISAQSPEFREELTDFFPDVIGVSSWSPMFLEALDVFCVAKEINPSVTTVIGGAHASSYVEQVMAHKQIDFLFQGEAELSFPIFLQELQKDQPAWSVVEGLTYRTGDGNCVSNGSVLVNDLDRVKIPDYDAIDLDSCLKAGYRWNSTYKRQAPIWVTRGCPYRCQFCAAPMLNGRPIRKHSVDYMMEWIKYLYQEKHIRWFSIIDDNFTFDVRFAKDFCRAVIDLKLGDINFGTPNGVRMQRGDPELWRLMKQAGWINITVAPESGSEYTLARMEKHLDLDIVPKVVREIQQAGLKVQACFIIGYPGDRIEDIDLTAKFIRKSRFNFLFLNNFQPLPGTPVYDDLVSEGEIKAGLLPVNFSDGVRTYVPPGLRDFNFSRFVLRTHLLLALYNPLNIPYMIKIIFNLYSPRLVVKKILLNIVSMYSLDKVVVQNRFKKCWLMWRKG
jgi:anaerobic magnesium-protoporphyrin IX monomethyl ester cyclase